MAKMPPTTLVAIDLKIAFKVEMSTTQDGNRIQVALKGLDRIEGFLDDLAEIAKRHGVAIMPQGSGTLTGPRGPERPLPGLLGLGVPHPGVGEALGRRGGGKD
jgi:hypothetical protein